MCVYAWLGAFVRMFKSRDRQDLLMCVLCKCVCGFLVKSQWWCVEVCRCEGVLMCAGVSESFLSSPVEGVLMCMGV